MRALVIAGLLFAAACGGKSGGETMDPCKDPCKDKPAVTHTCADVGANLAADLRAEAENPDDVSDRVPDAVADACQSSGWSQETIDCTATATTPEQGQACEAGMTEEQKSELMLAIEAAAEADIAETQGTDDEGME